MANVRNANDREGLGYVGHTYTYDATITYDATKAGGSASVGLAVMFTGNETVGLTSDAAAVIGKLMKVEADGNCSVMRHGNTKLPAGLAATVTAGNKACGATGAAAARGYIRDAATTAEIAASSVRIQEASDATAVEVEL